MAEAEHATVDRPRLVAREPRKTPEVPRVADPSRRQARAVDIALAAHDLDPMTSEEEREDEAAIRRVKERKRGECGKCRTRGAQQLSVPNSRCQHAALCPTCHEQLLLVCDEDAELAAEICVAVCRDCVAEMEAEVSAAAAGDAEDATQPMS